MSDRKWNERPSFSAPLWAAARLGSKEVAKDLLPAFPDSSKPIEEPGTLGNPTQQMVTAQHQSHDGYDEMLDKYASRGQERGEPERELERE